MARQDPDDVVPATPVLDCTLNDALVLKLDLECRLKNLFRRFIILCHSVELPAALLQLREEVFLHLFHRLFLILELVLKSQILCPKSFVVVTQWLAALSALVYHARLVVSFPALSRGLGHIFLTNFEQSLFGRRKSARSKQFHRRRNLSPRLLRLLCALLALFNQNLKLLLLL